MFWKRLFVVLLFVLSALLLPVHVHAEEDDPVNIVVEPADFDEDTVQETALQLHMHPNVVTLTETTFEHTTQASTGQTTGSWLIWFHNDNDKVTFPGNEFPNESEWLEQHMVLGAVHSMEHKVLERFQITEFPTFVFIHKGKYYKVPKSLSSKSTPYIWTDVQAFCQQPQTTLARDIPAPPNFVNDLLSKVQNAKGTTPFIMVGVVVALVLWTLAFALGGGSKDNKSKNE